MESWLAAGGVVLAASERAARSLMADFHAGQRDTGRMAWKTPAIFTWDAWVRDQWKQRRSSMLLNPLQEQSLWCRAIERSRPELLSPSRLAAAAMRAYALLCDYAPAALQSPVRFGWSGDAGVFSAWIEEFEAICRRESLVSPSRLVVELTEALHGEARHGEIPMEPHAKLLLAGFDRLLDTQRTLLEAWGAWELLELPAPAKIAEFRAAPDASAELEACAAWLHRMLAANPNAKLMVVATGLQARRGELERALLDSRLDFEFSMGVPLAQLGIARSALLLLRWIEEPISEAELDWLLGSGHLAVSKAESMALAQTMRQLRRDGREQTEWQMAQFVSHAPDTEQETGWAQRLPAAQALLRAEPLRQSPLNWVSVAERLLETLGWPGFHPLASLGFQARDRFQRVLEDCGSLGFDGNRIEWAEFVANLADAVSGTIFAAEAREAGVQVTGPIESAGQLADAIWFLGADEDNWPGRALPNPLIPIGVQREAGMPHASPQADWLLAAEATERLLSSAESVVFSYARQKAGVEARPSRLILDRLGRAVDIAPSTVPEQTDRTETFEDWTQLPFPVSAIPGGATTLTRQSQCPFQAFAKARLAAEDFDPAQAGLTARQRGLLLHEVLHRVWARNETGNQTGNQTGTKNGGLRSLAELQAIPDLQIFAGAIVDRVMMETFDPAAQHNSLPNRFPARYLELESERLTGLVAEWLAYERQREPFTVVETEVGCEVTIAGLTLRLRLDRLDVVEGGSLIIDYKTGMVGPSAWESDRPDDVQLPLYAAFAVPENLEGLLFAKVRTGESHFSGRVRAANTSLLADLSPSSALVRNPLDDDQLQQWRQQIEQLGQDFLHGHAEVNPKDPKKTCKTCHLQAICRIAESQSLLEEQQGAENDGGDDAEPEA